MKALWQGQVEKVELLNLPFQCSMILCFCADVIKEVKPFSCMGLLYNDFLRAKKFIFVGVRHLHLLFSLSMSHHFEGIYGLYTYGFSFRIVFFIFLNLGIDISTAYVISLSVIPTPQFHLVSINERLPASFIYQLNLSKTEEVQKVSVVSIF